MLNVTDIYKQQKKRKHGQMFKLMSIEVKFF